MLKIVSSEHNLSSSVTDNRSRVITSNALNQHLKIQARLSFDNNLGC